jgi:pantoate--beta-alanine ligase
MRIVRTVAELREVLAPFRGGGVAFVPTMGFLHAGHTSLMREGTRRAGMVVASIFVNPLQFGPKEDLSRYPRDPEGDARKCEEAGVGVLWCPEVEDLYPEGFQTRVVTGELAGPLCGRSRPGHFDGVATVVLKLLLAVAPGVAIFGRKDWQQLRVVERMVEDFALPVQILGMPIVREPDGLAMSSRNAYLGAEDRVRALVLSAALREAEARWRRGERDPESLRSRVEAMIGAEGRADIDYVEARHALTLRVADATVPGPLLLAVAVKFGTTRLIDNVVLG